MARTIIKLEPGSILWPVQAPLSTLQLIRLCGLVGWTHLNLDHLRRPSRHLCPPKSYFPLGLCARKNTNSSSWLALRTRCTSPGGTARKLCTSIECSFSSKPLLAGFTSITPRPRQWHEVVPDKRVVMRGHLAAGLHADHGELDFAGRVHQRRGSSHRVYGWQTLARSAGRGCSPLLLRL